MYRHIKTYRRHTDMHACSDITRLCIDMGVKRWKETCRQKCAAFSVITAAALNRLGCEPTSDIV
uniref:Transposase n=1 Tax=Elaeophora elaphi TaxID=1147741 RepID=A0A0R3RGV1_9BILA